MRTVLVPPPLVAGPFRLEGEEAHHARTVLRLESGDRVRLADGAGWRAEAVIMAVARHHLELVVDPPQPVPEPAAAVLTVALAPPKGDRLGDCIRGLTELGVGGITLLATARGERLPGNLDRLQRIAGEALKQCGRGRVPVIDGPTALPDLAHEGRSLTVLDREGEAPVPGLPRPATLVIGPEGGLTSAELDLLAAAGARRVRLAAPILRIETAAIAAAAVWTATWENHRP